jgi:hypothetical protein
MIVIGYRTSFVIACSEVDRPIGSTVASNDPVKSRQRGSRTARFADGVSAGADTLRSSAAAVDVRDYSGTIDLEIEKP